ncbi:DUF6445 family protein [Marinimicrobium koreense]|uniref:DUF6445 family protein n=1 Tax=Marinimicrobium koreense TaxID=306545 RepID=UPI003F727471
MSVEFHPDVSFQFQVIGEEKAPLLVVDNFIRDPEGLVEQAEHLDYEPPKIAYPGVRALAPKEYQEFLLRELLPRIARYFSFSGTTLHLGMCHYSLVTKSPEELSLVQRIPHVDSFDSGGLATIHYLFHKDMGGTAFYQHRDTGYEIIDESRKINYFRSLESAMHDSRTPPAEYINGDTPLFKQIGVQKGVYNRLLVYRRNSLHSGCIDKNFVPDFNPKTGRLSINSFIDFF